jgi:CoA:oxalate CoA-transferase
MDYPLTGCGLVGPSQLYENGFLSVWESLGYQSGNLGLSYSTHEELNSQQQLNLVFTAPGILPVECTVRGWTDQPLLVASESVMQAATGIMSVHGRASGKAQPLGVDYVSCLTAVLSLQGAMAASIAQLRGSNVRKCSVSMASAGILAVGQYVAGATTCQGREQYLPACSSIENRPPFISSDGIIFELEALSTQPWLDFWQALGMEDKVSSRGWKDFLLRYARGVAPLPKIMMSRISEFSYQDINQLCLKTGMAICPLRDVAEFSKDKEIDDFVRFGAWDFSLSTVKTINSDKPSGSLPLSGFTVIESCRRIQGPLAGHLLALLGADVIRIEPPGLDPLRGMEPMVNDCSARFDALNYLKEIREIDIKSVKGRAEVEDLVRDADVFLHNWAPNKAEELQLDYERLKKINPALVYGYAGGWGRKNNASIPGTDFMAQAYSGVAKKIAQGSNMAGGSLFTVLDVLGGIVASQGIVAALLQRELNNTGCYVESSLLGAAALLCHQDISSYLNLHQSKKIQPLVLSEIFQTSDGFLCIECTSISQLERLADSFGFDFEAEISELINELRVSLLTNNRQHWLNILASIQVPSALIVEDLLELQSSELVQSCLNVNDYTRINTPWSFI